MIKWTLIVLGSLVLIVVAVTVVGLLLPKAHRASRTVTLRASPSDIFRVITDVATASTWRSDVERVDDITGAGVGMTFREVGKNGTVLYRVEVFEPGRKFVSRIADQSLPFGGTWTFDLMPAGDGTTLTITEDGEVYNPIFRFMSKFFISPTATIERYQADLARRK